MEEPEFNKINDEKVLAAEVFAIPAVPKAQRTEGPQAKPALAAEAAHQQAQVEHDQGGKKVEALPTKAESACTQKPRFGGPLLVLLSPTDPPLAPGCLLVPTSVVVAV